MSEREILIERRLVQPERQDFVAVVTLNRPEVANAFNAGMIKALSEAWQELGDDPDCRVLVLNASGKHFSAGADLGWMKSSATLTFGENIAEAKVLASMFDGLYRFPRPTIAVIKGSAYGGAVGLASCCDVVVAAEDAKFCLSEVKLGMLPAVIFPYLARRMNAGALRRYSLSARVFHGEEAKLAGLVDLCVPAEQVNETVRQELTEILSASPEGQRAAKKLHQWLVDHSFDAGEQAIEAISRARVGSSGQHGLTSFFNKATPSWKLTLEKDWNLFS